MTPARGWTTRRRFLAAGAGAASLLAGCVAPGFSEDGDPGSGGDDTDPYLVFPTTVRGRVGLLPNQADCERASRFRRRQQVVFRIKVIDPETGESVGPDSLSRVAVRIPSAGTFEASYTGQPPQDPTDHFWTVAWIVPDNYPTGPVYYDVVVDDGREVEVISFDVRASKLTVVPGDPVQVGMGNEGEEG